MLFLKLQHHYRNISAGMCVNVWILTVATKRLYDAIRLPQCKDEECFVKHQSQCWSISIGRRVCVCVGSTNGDILIARGNLMAARFVWMHFLKLSSRMSKHARWCTCLNVSSPNGYRTVVRSCSMASKPMWMLFLKSLSQGQHISKCIPV